MCPGPYKWSMDPVQNGGSMDPWSLFCAHFLGVKGLISIPRKIGSSFSEARHSQKMSNNASWLVDVVCCLRGNKTTSPKIWFQSLTIYNTSVRIHSNLVDSLCQLCEFGYGFTNLITQPTWRSILFCVYEPVHWSKNIALLSYILPSLFKRASKNEWQTWRDHMPGMSQKVSGSRERLSQRFAGQFSNEQFVGCNGYSKM